MWLRAKPLGRAGTRNLLQETVGLRVLQRQSVVEQMQRALHLREYAAVTDLGKGTLETVIPCRGVEIAPREELMPHAPALSATICNPDTVVPTTGRGSRCPAEVHLRREECWGKVLPRRASAHPFG